MHILKTLPRSCFFKKSHKLGPRIFFWRWFISGRTLPILMHIFMRIWDTFILRLLPLIGTCLDVSLLVRSSNNYLLERFDSRACWRTKSNTHAMPSPGNVITYWNLSRREQITYWNFLLAGAQKVRCMPCPHQET
jgi:hypothetical protein